MKLLVMAPTVSRIQSASNTPKPGMWNPSKESGRQVCGRISKVWSSVTSTHCTTQIVMLKGAITSMPANSHLRSAVITRWIIWFTGPFSYLPPQPALNRCWRGDY